MTKDGAVSGQQVVVLKTFGNTAEYYRIVHFEEFLYTMGLPSHQEAMQENSDGSLQLKVL